MSDRTALYRHFDASGRLLYVGISLSAVHRLGQHKTNAHWFASIARVEIQWHATRFLALEAEAFAIERENPMHNTVRPRPPAGATLLAYPSRGPQYSFAIAHVASGRRDGNYFDEAVARDMLRWWRSEFPGEEFELISARRGEPLWPHGATDRAAPLRPSASPEWRVAA